MSRQRLTWTKQKTASPPPQIPAVDRTEGPDHPAYLPDPPADKYQTGDTSTWAEDPHPPPYKQSPPPAMPGNGTTEEATHPAHITQVEVPATGPTTAEEADARAPKQASEENIRVAAERHAAVCVRIAQATLKDATVADIERRAMALMDLPREQIAATAATLNITAADDEDEDQDEASDEDDDAKMGDKKASQQITALNKKVDRLVKAFSDFFGMDGLMDDGEAELDMMMDDDGDDLDMMMEDDMSDDDLMDTLMGMDQDGDGIDQNADDYAYTAQDDFDEGEESEGTKEYDEGAMLAALMAELGEGHMASDAELSVEPLAKGPTIQSGEGGNVNPEPAPVTPEVEQMDGSEKTAMPDMSDIQMTATEDPSENDIAMTAGVDPMGLMDDSTIASTPNDELLALYADLDLPKTAKKGGEDEDDDDDDDDDSEEVEVEEEVEEKEAGKKTAQRPQARKASTGPKTLGTVQQTKKAADEIAELSQIWDQAPDVREFFGIPK